MGVDNTRIVMAHRGRRSNGILFFNALAGNVIGKIGLFEAGSGITVKMTAAIERWAARKILGKP